MAGLFDAREWTGAVAKLKAKAAEFLTILARIDATGPAVVGSPELRAERAKLIERAGFVRATIEKVTHGIDYVYSIWDSVFGGNSVSGVGALGIIPLVPIVVIAGAGSAITYWITDALKFLKRVDEVEKLKSEGISTQQAYAIVNREGGLIGFMRAALPVAVIGGIIWFISRKQRV